MKYKQIGLIVSFVLMSFFSLQYVNAEEIVEVQTLDSLVVKDHFVSIRTPDPVKFKVPSEDKIREFKKQKEFDYTEEPPKLNWIQRLLASIIDMFRGATRTVSSSGVMLYPVIIILALLLLFVIFKVFKISPKRLLGKKKLQSNEDIDFESENVHDMNFADLIAKAINSEDYRLAVRYLYLRNLKKLSDKEYVVWNPNKTNTSYVQELRKEDMKKHFFRTSLIFDYVWYGEMILDKPNFDIAREELETFEKLLDNER